MPRHCCGAICLIYGVGGMIAPFIGIKLIDMLITARRAGLRTLMKKHLITAFLMTIATTVLLGLIYPLVVTGLAQVLFHDKANGQILHRNGEAIGSRIIGQPFTSAKYFHSRPSLPAMDTTPPTPAAQISLPPTRN